MSSTAYKYNFSSPISYTSQAGLPLLNQQWIADAQDTLKMARGNQRDKAREATQKKMAAQVGGTLERSVAGYYSDGRRLMSYFNYIEVGQYYVWK